MPSFEPLEHEVFSAMHPVLVRYRCESCNKGYMYMIETPASMMQSGMLKHKCDNCGEEMILRKQYPTMIFLNDIDYGKIKDRIVEMDPNDIKE